MKTLYSKSNALWSCCLVAIAILCAFPAMAQTTFPFSASPALDIPDAAYNGALISMASNTIAVSGVTGTSVINIEVDLNINHTWVGDLIIKLRAPNGNLLTLVSRPGATETDDLGVGGAVGSSADMNGSTLTFSDLGITDAEAMATGLTDAQFVCTTNGLCSFFPNPGATTSPTQTFASLFGGTMNGNWTLFVGDRFADDIGTLNSWSIRISTVSPAIITSAFVSVDDDGDCSNDPLPATTSINVPAGTDVCYFYVVQNDGDVALGLHDIFDSELGLLGTGFAYDLQPQTAVGIVVSPVTIVTSVTSTTDFTSYNAGPTDVATSSASSSVFIIPDNDLCTNATVLACGQSVTGTTLGASDAGNNAALDCGELAGDLGVWYTFVGTGNQMSLSTCGPVSDVNDPVFMAVYTGGCGAFSCVINNSALVPAVGCGFVNGQELIFATTEGET